MNLTTMLWGVVHATGDWEQNGTERPRRNHSGRAASLVEPAEERRLFERWCRGGDRAARQQLIEGFLPLAERLARRYSHTPEPMEDLVQVASVGLVSAVERFDPERGTPFATFAVPTILGELKRHFRDRSWSVHVPRPVQERALKTEHAVRELTGCYGRSPTVPELALQLGLSVEEVVEALGAASAHDSASLDAPRSDDPDAGTHLDSLGVEEGHYELVEYGVSISRALVNLPERHRVALHLRFVEDMTQSQIAERLGTSQMQVSRVLRAALAVLRVAAGEQEGGADVPGPTRRRRSYSG